MNLILNRQIERWSEFHARFPNGNAVFACEETEHWEEFWKAAEPLIRTEVPEIFWPDSLILDGVLYQHIEHPTCHLFAASKAALNTIRLSSQSECDRVIHRVLALNPHFRGGPIFSEPIPTADSKIHARKPHCRYPARA